MGGAKAIEQEKTLKDRLRRTVGALICLQSQRLAANPDFF
jgi:hypothetical protein